MNECLELFSGAGGLAKGLELAGFQHKAFVEYNKDACQSLICNYGKEYVHNMDIRNFDFIKAKGADIIAGGPPCQPFSLGGKHKGNSDSRDMFPYAIQAIEKLAPKAFIFENVKGLLRESFSDYFNYIILRLSYPEVKFQGGGWQAHLKKLKTLEKTSFFGLHYNVKFQLVNAADYGVPQCRERVLIVGLRSDFDHEWKFPPPTHFKDRLLWEKYVTLEYWEKNRVSKKERSLFLKNARPIEIELRNKWGLFEPEGFPWLTIRDAIGDLPDPQSNHGVSDHLFRGGARTYKGHTGSDFDLPSKTVKAGGNGVPGGENMIRFSDDSIRYFTVLEAKRIQTFPDDYIITGSWGEAMRQIGNAVPVKLAQFFGSHLKETMKRTSCDNS